MLAEQGHLKLVAGGKVIAVNTPRPMPLPAAAPRKLEADAPVPAKALEQPKPEQVALLSIR